MYNLHANTATTRRSLQHDRIANLCGHLSFTEEISGLDLVEWQLKIASGEELTIERSQLTIHGHAIEVRIYAEDPVRFFPSPGTITKLVLPQGAGIRHEAGVEEGSVVTPFYDPMIAKLITTGTTRDEAVTRMQQALADYVVEGIKTNIPMLRDVVAHPEFKAGRTTTKFVEQYYLPEVAKK